MLLIQSAFGQETGQHDVIATAKMSQYGIKSNIKKSQPGYFTFSNQWIPVRWHFRNNTRTIQEAQASFYGTPADQQQYLNWLNGYFSQEIIPILLAAAKPECNGLDAMRIEPSAKLSLGLFQLSAHVGMLQKMLYHYSNLFPDIASQVLDNLGIYPVKDPNGNYDIYLQKQNGEIINDDPAIDHIRKNERLLMGLAKVANSQEGLVSQFIVAHDHYYVHAAGLESWVNINGAHKDFIIFDYLISDMAKAIITSLVIWRPNSEEIIHLVSMAMEYVAQKNGLKIDQLHLLPEDEVVEAMLHLAGNPTFKTRIGKVMQADLTYNKKF